LQLFNFGGRTDIVVDVLGWFPSTPTFTAIRAARLLDTRGGSTVDGLWSGGGPISGGATLDVRVTGRAGVPGSGVAAVLLNLTVAEPTASGFLTAYPAGIARPPNLEHQLRTRADAGQPLDRSGWNRWPHLDLQLAGVDTIAH
jgi:hypothetical protein